MHIELMRVHYINYLIIVIIKICNAIMDEKPEKKKKSISMLILLYSYNNINFIVCT